MVNFEDLSPEDQGKILEQARQMVDEENIRKNAIAMFGMKKKDLVEQHLEELYKKFNVKPGPEQSALKQRYGSMVNYLYKMTVDKGAYNRRHANTVKAISTEKEWKIYLNVSNKVKDMMMSCME